MLHPKKKRLIQSVIIIIGQIKLYDSRQMICVGYCENIVFKYDNTRPCMAKIFDTKIFSDDNAVKLHLDQYFDTKLYKHGIIDTAEKWEKTINKNYITNNI